MKRISRAALILGLVSMGLSACTSNPFSNQDDVYLGGDNANAGLDNGLNADPNSPQYFQQTIGDRIFFAVDENNLSSEARLILDGQAAWLQTNQDYIAVIEGHADEQGTREYNLALGARRASAVKEYLISKGISSSRLREVSFGKERPIEICSDEFCYSKNRRSVTVISAGYSS